MAEEYPLTVSLKNILNSFLAYEKSLIFKNDLLYINFNSNCMLFVYLVRIWFVVLTLKKPCQKTELFMGFLYK